MEIEYFIAPDDDVWPVEHQKWIDGCAIAYIFTSVSISLDVYVEREREIIYI